MTAIGKVARLAVATATIALSTATQVHHRPTPQTDARAQATCGFTELLAPGSSSGVAAQTAVVTRPLVGTWKLTLLKRADAGQPLAAVPNPYEKLRAYQRDAVGLWKWESAGRYNANGN